jgi:hypothetical protein
VQRCIVAGRLEAICHSWPNLASANRYMHDRYVPSPTRRSKHREPGNNKFRRGTPRGWRILNLNRGGRSHETAL